MLTTCSVGSVSSPAAGIAAVVAAAIVVVGTPAVLSAAAAAASAAVAAAIIVCDGAFAAVGPSVAVNVRAAGGCPGLSTAVPVVFSRAAVAGVAICNSEVAFAPGAAAAPAASAATADVVTATVAAAGDGVATVVGTFPFAAEWLLRCCVWSC